MKNIAILFLVLLLPMVAGADDAVEINGLYYYLIAKAKKAEVTSNPNKYTNSVVIPKSVTYNGLEYNVTSIGESAFGSCYNLTSITIPSSVTSIGKSAFLDCFNLTSVYISDIDAWCKISFNDSYSNPLFYAYQFYLGEELINKLVIPNNVTSIEKHAFSRFRGLTSVTIGNSVTSIGQFAFSDCSNLTSATIGNGVTHIKAGTFQNCNRLASVTIPNSVRSIEDGYIGGKYYGAFQNCSSLISLTIPNSVTSIGSCAFMDCSGLTSVIIPNGVKGIGDYAFRNCSTLTSVVIPSSILSIGEDAFQECNSLAAVHISEIAAWCNISFNGNYSNPLYKAHHLYLGEEEINDLVIPSSVTSIGDYAFSYCSGLNSVTIPNNVTNIGSHAFSICSGLTSLTIPNSVKTIGEWAFYGCRGLASVIIPNSVTKIDKLVFCNCSNLKSVTIPNSVTSIGSSAFKECTSLSSVIIPNSVTWIGEWAFSGCSGLTSLTIGSGIKNIYRFVFDSCKELTDVYCWAENVPNTESDAFRNSYIEYATLHVPATSVEAYGAKAPWYSFKSIVAIDDSEIPGETPDDPVTDIKTVTINFDDDYATLFPTITGLSSGSGVNAVTDGDITETVTSTEVSGITVTVSAADEGVTPNRIWATSPRLRMYSGTFTVRGTNITKIEFDANQRFGLTTTQGTLNENTWTGAKTSEVIFSVESNTQLRKIIVTLDNSEGDSQKCATPTIAYIDGKLVFDSETEGASFVSEIKTADTRNYYNKEVSLTPPTTTITVYATKADYENSDVATATIGWRNGTPILEGFSSIKLEGVETNGDVNGDGTVDVADIATIISIMAGNNPQ
ncbi:MAG: leucine-rich repeat protein [Prevotella sp.]|nr:leucine-rich repeat protein [Prevotella sp.]